MAKGVIMAKGVTPSAMTPSAMWDTGSEPALQTKESEACASGGKMALRFGPPFSTVR